MRRQANNGQVNRAVRTRPATGPMDPLTALRTAYSVQNNPMNTNSQLQNALDNVCADDDIDCVPYLLQLIAQNIGVSTDSAINLIIVLRQLRHELRNTAFMFPNYFRNLPHNEQLKTELLDFLETAPDMRTSITAFARSLIRNYSFLELVECLSLLEDSDPAECHDILRDSISYVIDDWITSLTNQVTPHAQPQNPFVVAPPAQHLAQDDDERMRLIDLGSLIRNIQDQINRRTLRPINVNQGPPGGPPPPPPPPPLGGPQLGGPPPPPPPDPAPDDWFNSIYAQLMYIFGYNGQFPLTPLRYSYQINNQNNNIEILIEMINPISLIIRTSEMSHDFFATRGIITAYNLKFNFIDEICSQFELLHKYPQPQQLASRLWRQLQQLGTLNEQKMTKIFKVISFMLGRPVYYNDGVTMEPSKDMLDDNKIGRNGLYIPSECIPDAHSAIERLINSESYYNIFQEFKLNVDFDAGNGYTDKLLLEHQNSMIRETNPIRQNIQPFFPISLRSLDGILTTRIEYSQNVMRGIGYVCKFLWINQPPNYNGLHRAIRDIWTKLMNPPPTYFIIKEASVTEVSKLVIIIIRIMRYIADNITYDRFNRFQNYSMFDQTTRRGVSLLYAYISNSINNTLIRNFTINLDKNGDLNFLKYISAHSDKLLTKIQQGNNPPNDREIICYQMMRIIRNVPTVKWLGDLSYPAIGMMGARLAYTVPLADSVLRQTQENIIEFTRLHDIVPISNSITTSSIHPLFIGLITIDYIGNLFAIIDIDYGDNIDASRIPMYAMTYSNTGIRKMDISVPVNEAMVNYFKILMFIRNISLVNIFITAATNNDLRDFGIQIRTLLNNYNLLRFFAAYWMSRDLTWWNMSMRLQQGAQGAPVPAVLPIYTNSLTNFSQEVLILNNVMQNITLNDVITQIDTCCGNNPQECDGDPPLRSVENSSVENFASYLYYGVLLNQGQQQGGPGVPGAGGPEVPGAGGPGVPGAGGPGVPGARVPRVPPPVRPVVIRQPRQQEEGTRRSTRIAQQRQQELLQRPGAGRQRPEDPMEITGGKLRTRKQNQRVKKTRRRAFNSKTKKNRIQKKRKTRKHK